jgi:hypothetical protein
MVIFFLTCIRCNEVQRDKFAKILRTEYGFLPADVLYDKLLQYIYLTDSKLYNRIIEFLERFHRNRRTVVVNEILKKSYLRILQNKGMSITKKKT